MRPRVNQSAVLQRRAAALKANQQQHQQHIQQQYHQQQQMGSGGTKASSTPPPQPAPASLVLNNIGKPVPPAFFLNQLFPFLGAATSHPDTSEVGMAFEMLIFAYSMVAMMLQHLHLYRSVFWLPHSYTNQAVNWFLVEWHLIAFAAILLGRRIAWTFVRWIISQVTPSQWAPSILLVARSLTTLAILCGLFVTTYQIMQRHPMVNMLYLTYPALLYFFFFGFAGEPFLELIPKTAHEKFRIYREPRTGAYKTTYLPPGPRVYPGPEAVRKEMELFKADFNARFKQVAFNSLCCAYYSTFIPCAFATSALFYEMGYAGRHVILSFAGCFALYFVQCFPAAYLHAFHRTANYVGRWERIEGRVTAQFYTHWSDKIYWPKGAIVRCGKNGSELFRAEALTNVAEPGNSAQARFYFYFCDASFVGWMVFMLQCGLVMAQHLSLGLSTHWYQLISETILLFANYYALFKTGRDFLVFSKLNNREEECAQELEPM